MLLLHSLGKARMNVKNFVLGRLCYYSDNKARAMCKSEDCLKGLKLVKFTKIPCDDFLVMGLKYHHIQPPSPDIDYIAIRLDLRDTRSGSTYKVPVIWLLYLVVYVSPDSSEILLL